MTQKPEAPPADLRTLLGRKIPTIENLHAPEIFATEASFFASGPGTVTITFSSYRFDNSVTPGEQKRVIIARLVMPVSGAQGLAVGLYDYLKQHNQDPMPPPADPKQVQ